MVFHNNIPSQKEDSFLQGLHCGAAWLHSEIWSIALSHLRKRTRVLSLLNVGNILKGMYGVLKKKILSGLSNQHSQPTALSYNQPSWLSLKLTNLYVTLRICACFNDSVVPSPPCLQEILQFPWCLLPKQTGSGPLHLLPAGAADGRWFPSDS